MSSPLSSHNSEVSRKVRRNLKKYMAEDTSFKIDLIEGGKSPIFIYNNTLGRLLSFRIILLDEINRVLCNEE